jgi:hypothetical protein
LVTGRAEFVIAAAIDGDGFFKLGEEQAPGSLSQHAFAWCEINVGEISGLYFCLGQAVIIYLFLLVRKRMFGLASSKLQQKSKNRLSPLRGQNYEPDRTWEWMD